MEAVLVLSYRGVVPGREEGYLRFGEDAGVFWGKLVAEGVCQEPEFLVGLGGTGLYLIRGDYDALSKVLASPEGQRLFAACRLYYHEFDVSLMLTGQAADAFAGYWTEELRALA